MPALVSDTGVMGSAVAGQRNDVPPPQRWRVAVGATILHNGARTILKVGKELDERCYDLQALRRQGVTLVPVE